MRKRASEREKANIRLLSLEVPLDLYERIKIDAASLRMKMNQTVRQILYRYYNLVK